MQLILVQIENKLFLKFINKLKPSYKPPTRYQLAGSILEETYGSLKAHINTFITQQPDQMTLVSDGWSNTRGESIINYLLVTEKDAIFLKSVATGKDHHTGEYIADGLEEVIEEVGAHRISAVTTDNASNMTSSWRLLQERYPKLTCLGCGSHQTNLLVGNIFRRDFVKHHFARVCFLNRYWKSSGRRIGLLEQVATALSTPEKKVKMKAVQLPGKTRWQGKLYTAESAYANQVLFENAILRQDECLPKHASPADKAHYNSVRRLILDSDFWSLTQQLCDLLQPFLEVTIALESNEPKLSRIYAYYTHLLKSTSLLNSSFLPGAAARELISERFKKIYKPFMAIAYLCDPKARDQRPVTITERQLSGVRDWLRGYFNGDEARAAHLYTHLLLLRDRRGRFADSCNGLSRYCLGYKVAVPREGDG